MTVLVYRRDHKTAKHSEGTGIDVKDGHLYVLKKDGQAPVTVALYSPAQWERAEVGDQAAPTG